MAKLCEGRVAIVTGAGRGIGREHALMLREASLKAFGRTVVPRVGTSGASFHCIRDRGAYGGMDSVGHLPWHSA